MMTDVEPHLRDLLDARARDGVIDPTPAPRLLRRARRRQVAVVVTSVLGATALVAASVVGLQAIGRNGSPAPRPADTAPVLPDAPA
jgi:hypothetical protein